MERSSTDREPGRMKVRLNQQQLSKILDIPEGARVVGVTSGIDPIHVEVIVESPAFPTPYPDGEALYVYGKTVEVPAGQRPHAEWDWDATIAANTPPQWCPACLRPRDANPACPNRSFHHDGEMGSDS